MDPDKTYEELLAALKDGDESAAIKRAEALARWIRRGGFTPRQLSCRWPELSERELATVLAALREWQGILDFVVERCDRVGVPRNRVVLAHADLGRVEWPGTRELAEEQARRYGLAFHAVRRRQGDLLDHIAKRHVPVADGEVLHQRPQ